MLAIFLINIIVDGIARIDWAFITNLPSRKAENAGIYTALMGTVWILVLTAIIAIPIGVAAGIYLEEYGKKSRLANILEINITNLAGIPSIIYGILGLEVFVRTAGLGSSLLAGALTLSLLILPIIIVSTREAIKAVPKTIKEASFALGASKWKIFNKCPIYSSQSINKNINEKNSEHNDSKHGASNCPVFEEIIFCSVVHFASIVNR